VPSQTATRSITDTAQRRYNNNNNNNIIIIIIGKIKAPFSYNVLTIIQFNSIQFIYVQNLTATGQLQS
jgi:hypothetical protein